MATVEVFSVFTQAFEVTYKGNTSVASLQWQKPFLEALFLDVLIFKVLNTIILLCAFETLGKMD